MSPLELINKYYPVDSDLRRLLLVHSWSVAIKSLEVAHRHPELRLNRKLLFEGGLLHDIGVFLTHAPTICCNGTAHYLLHGCYGGLLLRKEGYEALARISERHTGTGLLPEDFIREGLPVPTVGVQPETMEEKVVCYADKFYSKSSVGKVKTPEQIYLGLKKYSQTSADRFAAWHKIFG